MMQNKRRAAAGFTLIEAMMAIVIFSIGMMGLVSLQKVSMSAGAMGRDHTAGTNVARFALTWLQNEAAHFATVPGNSNLIAADYPLLTAGIANLNGYNLLDTTMPSFRLDGYMGNSSEVKYAGTDATDTAQYCVYYRLSQFTSFKNTVTDTTGFVGEMYKATVRVSWPREKSYTKDEWTNCDTRTAMPDLSDYQVLELSGIISREFSSGL